MMNGNNSSRFHKKFDAEMEAITEFTRDALLEGPGTCSREEIVAQIMMDNLFPNVCDPEASDYDEVFKGKLTRDQKVVLVGIAEHMGPDWAQALYHAAVFITKVA